MPIAILRTFRLFVVAAVALAPMSASGASQRTFVSGRGSDAAACSVTLPCRSFAAAILQTIAGGEVIVLDSAGYGPVTIAQSVTITAPPGVYAGISVPASTLTGVVVNAPSVIVILRGLTINSTGGVVGISFVQGDGLTVERCRISGFGHAAGNSGIAQVSVGKLGVRDTVISDSYFGLYLGAGNATLDGVSIERTAVGVNVPGGKVTIRGSAISDGQVGVQVENGAAALDGVTVARMTSAGAVAASYSSGHRADVTVIRSQIVGAVYCAYAEGVPGTIDSIRVTDSLLANCGTGVYTFGSAQAILSHATIVDSGIGLNSTNDNIYTLQNNEVFGNASSSNGLVLPVSYQ